MAAHILDRLIDLTPPPSDTIPLTTLSPTFVHHDEQSGNDAFSGSEGLDQPSVTHSSSFASAPEPNLSTQANNSLSTRKQNENLRSYKKRTECLEILQEIRNALWQQFQQIQTLVFDAKEIECNLQELSKDELDVDIIRALRTLGNSLTGVRHILKGNIVMMEEAMATSTPSDFAYAASCSTTSPDATGMLNSGTETPNTIEDESDLLLDDGTTDEEILEFTYVDAQHTLDTGNSNVVLPVGADPFVDAPGEEVVNQLNLKYRPDVPGIHAHTPTTGVKSRCVILKNLPPDATLSQIARGVRCHGGLISIMMLNTAPIFGNDTKTVLLEFIHYESAADFTDTTIAFPLIYQARNGDLYSANPWLVSSSSYTLGHLDRGLLDSKYTRVLLLKGFPKECIWYFIDILGLKTIVSVDYDETNDGLAVEFTTLFQAHKVDWMIFSGKFSDFYHVDPQQGRFRILLDNMVDSRANPRLPKSPIQHLPSDDLEKEWNRYPFNDYLPRHLRTTTDQTEPTRLSAKARLALQYDIDESEVDDYLDDLEKHKNTEYRIIGSSITITRRKWGWSMSAEDEAKLFLENTLHEPGWEEHWDDHFKVTGEINRRKWEHYGMVAKHRREKAAEQGLGLDAVPICAKGCEMGCLDIKKVPAAAVVKKFLKGPRWETDE